MIRPGKMLEQVLRSVFKKPATHFYLTSIKMRFLKPVVPGDQLNLIVKMVKIAAIGGVCEAEAAVDGATVAKGEMTFACK